MAIPRIAEVSTSEYLNSILHKVRPDTPWLDRSNARDRLTRFGLPLAGKGRWQHTDLNRTLATAESPVNRQISVESTHGVEIQPFDRTPPKEARLDIGSSGADDEFPLFDVNGLLFQSGARLIANTNDSSVALEDTHGGIDRYCVKVQAGNSLRLEEQFTGGNRVLHCCLAEGATMDYELTMPRMESDGYHGLVVWLSAGATLNLDVAAQGGRLRRNELVINLIGDGATANLRGGWLIQNRDHFETQVLVNHRVGNNHSEQAFRGVVDDQGLSAFNGVIRIARNANLAEAHLTNRNIALSPRARAYTQPELEIYTDDVICSHGATTGQLDDDALYLLRSRGIEANRARSMLTNGFLRSAIRTDRGKAMLQL